MAGKKSAARSNVSHLRQITKDVKALNGKIHGSGSKNSDSGSKPKR
jgi:hypothetical protein